MADRTPAANGNGQVAGGERMVRLARGLLAAQFPDWAGLSLRPVVSGGSDNTILRLGTELVVRLPRVAGAGAQVAKESRWLPVLASAVPLDIPVPVAVGVPGAGFPWAWSVYRWLDGHNATVDRLADPGAAARALAGFLAALHDLDPAGGPPAGPDNGRRGVPLRERDTETRAAVAALSGLAPAAVLTAVWDAGLAAPVADRDGWLHGDLHPGNLLARAGTLTAVIDFGLLAVGDGACDLMVAWTLLDPPARAELRRTLAPDEAMWTRARAWALSFGAIAWASYLGTGADLERVGRYTVDQVLAD